MRPEETKRPAYLKIYEVLRGEITTGAYALSERVPSKRTMAEQTDTSVITVEHAYNLLIDEGYIEARERSGYFVCYRSEDAFPVGDASGNADDQQAEDSTSRLSEKTAGGTMISALAQAEGVPATDQYEAAAAELSFAGFALAERGDTLLPREHRALPAAEPRHPCRCFADHRGGRIRVPLQPDRADARA